MKIGLTGGIGCGKSTVVGIFRDCGWLTVETDTVVRQLLAEDPEVLGQIREHWGEAALCADGTVDRAAIGKIVFDDQTELTWLEQLLHPRVREVWTGRVAAHPERDSLVEIPLLFEKRLESEFDFTVCIHAPGDVVESRMQARGYDREEIERRRRRQMPIEEKMRRADHVITNAGSLEFLKQQTTRLISQLTTATD